MTTSVWASAAPWPTSAPPDPWPLSPATLRRRDLQHTYTGALGGRNDGAALGLYYVRPANGITTPTLDGG